MNLNALIYLLVNFFENERHISSLAIVNCFEEMDNVKLLKELSFNNLSVLLIPLNETNRSELANHLINFGILGVYLDYSCESSDKFIESVSINAIIDFILCIHFVYHSV